MPQFALAQLKGDVCLVQVSPDSLASSLTPSDVKVFRHEFITIFRYSHSLSVHPSDLRVLCTIDEQSALHDEEKETVWLTKDVMERLQKLMVASSPRSSIPVSRHGSVSTHASMQRRQRMAMASQQMQGQARMSHTSSMTRGVPTQRVVTFQC